MSFRVGRSALPIDMEKRKMNHKKIIGEILVIFAAISTVASLIFISLGAAKSPLILPWMV
jgi:hypothetical protein